MAYTAHPVWGFAPNWDEGVLERLEWKTDVLTSEIGTEQRVSRRLTPRRSMEATFLIQKGNRQYFNHLLGKYGASIWLIPLWHQVAQITAAAGVGTDVLTFDTTLREYRVGDYVIVRHHTDASIFEAVQIESVSAGSLNLSSNLERSWGRGAFVYPATLARLEDMVPATKKIDTLFEVRARFALPKANPFPSDWAPDLHWDVPVLTTRPDDSEDLTFEYRRLLLEVDNELGIPVVEDMKEAPIRRMQYRWSIAGRPTNDELRRMFYHLRGRARQLWLPTFMDDFTLLEDVDLGSSTLIVRDNGYLSLDMVALPWDHIMIETWDGTRHYHNVTVVSAGDPGTIVLGLSEGVASAISAAQTRQISYLVPVRLDQDSLEISHKADTDGLTQIVVNWVEVAAPGEPIPPEVEEGAYWVTENYNPNAGEALDGPALYEWAPVYMESEDEFIVTVYTEDGFSFGVQRRSVVDASLIAQIAYFDELWGADGEWMLDDNDGYVWLTHSWDGSLYRITKADWSATNQHRGTVSVPLGIQDTIGTDELTSGYYVLYSNPYTDDVWTADLDSFAVLHRISKTGTFAPAQTVFMAEGNVILDSPYAGQIDVHSYYGEDPAIFAPAKDNLIWVSETEAYFNDFPTSNIFKLDTTTGEVTYQFKLVNGAGSFSQHKPIFYDEPTNTLWFWGANNSWFEEFLEDPILTAGSLRKWAVGSSPSTIVDFTMMWDPELLPGGTTGTQTAGTDQRESFVSVDKYGRGVWINYVYSAPAEQTLQPRYFSFVTEEVTRSAFDTTTLVPTTGLGPFSWLAPRLTQVSATVAWGAWNRGQGPGADAAAMRWVKMTPGGERVAPLARYVRINLLSSNTGVAVALQSLEIHSEIMGVDITPGAAITATSEESGFPVTNLLLGEHADAGVSWHAEGTSFPQSITVDFGTEAVVREIQMWPISAASAPKAFTIEISLDGEAWTTQRQYQGIVLWPVGVSGAVATGRRFETY